jgi:hypothetical protein
MMPMTGWIVGEVFMAMALREKTRKRRVLVKGRGAFVKWRRGGAAA